MLSVGKISPLRQLFDPIEMTQNYWIKNYEKKVFYHDRFCVVAGHYHLFYDQGGR